jgi:hypothetical protein
MFDLYRIVFTWIGENPILAVAAGTAFAVVLYGADRLGRQL